MKLMWFHLMPYTELPDDFNQKHPSVWVDIHSSLFDPRRAHHMYNDFMDELEYAAEVRLRRRLRERASLQRLRADALAQPDRHLAGAPHHRHRALRHGQLAGALQSADARRRRVRHDRLHLGRPADRGLPGRLADGHLLRLRPEPQPAARALLRGARPGEEGLDREGDLRLLRPLQPAALRQHLAAADPERPASADLDPGRRLDRDVAVVRGDGLRLLLPLLLRLQGRPDDHAGLLERDGEARQGPQSLPRGLPAVRRRRREPPAGARPLHRAGRVFLRPLPACRCALRAAAGLHDRRRRNAPASKA